jgi:hypothetical protein
MDEAGLPPFVTSQVNQMKKLPFLRSLESQTDPKIAPKREPYASFLATMRSPGDSMQFVAL